MPRSDGSTTRPTPTVDDWHSLAEGLYAGYLWVQAVLGVVLWLGIWTSDTVRSWFELVPTRPEVTDAFAFGDLGLIVVTSALGAWGVRRRRSWALPVVAFTAGGVVYPTLFLIGWMALTDDGAIPLAVMVPVSVLTCWITWQLWREGRRTAG
ncbi:MAG: hypothetical protein U5R31_03510 [Acidimicrobiia bacterium]|nr:hypothetical protein [Acidimicrobiia bacterium]